jgi:hypothetical protein
MIRQSHAAATLILAAACMVPAGCGIRSSSNLPVPEVHTGSIDGYKYEMHGGSTLRAEQLPNEKGTEDYPKVTCGANWFSIRDRHLIVNGKDYGTVAKRGDTIKVTADGKVFVNGDSISALPLVPPPPPSRLGGEGNDLNK